MDENSLVEMGASETVETYLASGLVFTTEAKAIAEAETLIKDYCRDADMAEPGGVAWDGTEDRSWMHHEVTGRSVGPTGYHIGIAVKRLDADKED